MTIVIALIATYHFSRIIANPIIQLTKTAQIVRNGHWDISFSPASPDIDYMDYETNIDTDILQFKIPKLTLQPLVENAIYHGIKNKSQKGNLSISGWRKENFIFIEVYDDGRS